MASASGLISYPDASGRSCRLIGKVASDFVILASGRATLFCTPSGRSEPIHRCSQSWGAPSLLGRKRQCPLRMPRGSWAYREVYVHSVFELVRPRIPSFAFRKRMTLSRCCPESKTSSAKEIRGIDVTQYGQGLPHPELVSAQESSWLDNCTPKSFPGGRRVFPTLNGNCGWHSSIRLSVNAAAF